jgi:hypothetical protein
MILLIITVVQEAALSPEVMARCGSVNIRLERILRAARWIRYHLPDIPSGNSYNVGQVRMMWPLVDRTYGTFAPQSRYRLSLLALLDFLRSYQCFDPRDHIYGILGLYRQHISTVIPEALLPDYDKPLGLLLRDTTRLAFSLACEDARAGWPLSMLAKTFRTTGDLATSPSWSVAWHRTRDDQRDPALFNSIYSADDGKPAYLFPSTDGRDDELILSGCHVCKVTALFIPFDDDSFDSNVGVLKFLQTIRTVSNALSGGAIDETAIACTLVADSHFDQRWTPSACLTAFEQFQHQLERLELTEWPNSYDPEATQFESAAAQYRDIMFSDVCPNRACFITEDGRIGLGPRDTDCGDSVAILFGCPWPMVLKPRDTDDGHYELRGAAYVHGIMDGEAVRDRRKNGLGLVRIHLH